MLFEIPLERQAYIVYDENGNEVDTVYSLDEAIALAQLYRGDWA